MKRDFSQLYQALGGSAGLAAILKDFYGRMARDVLIGFFFDGKDPDEIARRQQAFLEKALGIRETYSGLLPTAAHRELPPILGGHFDRRLRLLEDTLRDHKIPEEAIQAWLEFERAFRLAIVSRD